MAAAAIIRRGLLAKVMQEQVGPTAHLAARRIAAGRLSAAALPTELPRDEGGAVNKQALGDATYRYIVAHTREAEVLRELRQATEERFPRALRMQVSPEQGAFLGWLVATLQARHIVEVGVFTGYSSIAMALAMPAGGRLVACDRDPASMALAREFWERAGVKDSVEARLGPAAEALQAMLDEGQAGSVDFAFIDADKRGYRQYYELLLQLVRPGGVIAIDNVLWYGKVADPGVDDKATLALRELNDFLVTDERVTMSMVAVGDGMVLCTKR